MIVHGYVVPEVVEMAIVAAMKGEFTAGQLTEAAMKAGAPELVTPEFFPVYCASRIVDRMLRRHKNAGQIEFSKGVWTMVVYEQALESMQAAEVNDTRVPYAWEVTQGRRTFLVPAAEFTKSSYDTGTFKPLFE